MHAQTEEIQTSYSERLHDYTQYCASVKEVIYQRDLRHLEHEDLEEMLSDNRAARDRVRAVPGDGVGCDGAALTSEGQLAWVFHAQYLYPNPDDSDTTSTVIATLSHARLLTDDEKEKIRQEKLAKMTQEISEVRPRPAALPRHALCQAQLTRSCSRFLV